MSLCDSESSSLPEGHAVHLEFDRGGKSRFDCKREHSFQTANTLARLHRHLTHPSVWTSSAV